MKNLKIYKRALAILTASTLVLMTGCGKSEDKKKEPKIEPCEHLTIYFEDQPITFKECEGYELDTYAGASSGVLDYDIKKDGHILIENGETNDYNSYKVYHEYADEIINNESIQKVK